VRVSSGEEAIDFEELSLTRLIMDEETRDVTLEALRRWSLLKEY
jgi:hypothetical protein